MFENPPKCCIKGCDSDKLNDTKNIGSFQFPIHDEILLKKWLRQIDLPHWKPSAEHRICGMHFQPSDILSRPNENQPHLKLTSIPTIFPAHPVEVLNQDATPPAAKSTEDPRPQIPTKFVDLVANSHPIQARPVILISARYPGEAAQFPPQMVVQNVGQTCVNNSMQISAQYVQKIVAGDSQLPLCGSAQLIKQINVQNYPTYRCLNGGGGVQSLPRIDAENVAQIVMQRPIFAQSPVGFSEQVSLRNIAEIGEQCVGQDPRSRLRRILPKPQSFLPDAPPAVKNPRKPRVEFAAKAVPKPDVLIVPRVEEPNPNGSGTRFFYRYPGNKRPILRISIDKEYSSKKTDGGSDKEEGRCSRSEAETRTTENEGDSSPREMTIENEATNKAVTFTLDPKTGEIVVTTRQLGVSTREEAERESTGTERKVDATHAPAAKLRRSCIKGQQEFVAPERRLRVLRRRHEREEEENQIVLDDEVPQTRCEDPAESRCGKRKESDQNGRLDEELSSLPKIRKTKEDPQTERDNRLRRDPTTRLNGRSKERENQSKKDEHLSLKIGTSNEEETAVNCGNDARKANEASTDFNGHSGS